MPASESEAENRLPDGEHQTLTELHEALVATLAALSGTAGYRRVTVEEQPFRSRDRDNEQWMMWAWSLAPCPAGLDSDRAAPRRARRRQPAP
jgi:hypothetical protein